MLCQSQIILLGGCADAKTQVYISIQYRSVCYIHTRLFGHSLNGTAWYGAGIHRYPYLLCKTKWTLIAISVYSPTVTKTTYIFKNSLYGNRISQCLRLRLFQLYFKERLALFQARGLFSALQKCNRGSRKHMRKKPNQLTLELLAVYP